MNVLLTIFTIIATIAIYLFIPVIFILIGKKRKSSTLLIISIISGFLGFFFFSFFHYLIDGVPANSTAAFLWSAISYLLMKKKLQNQPASPPYTPLQEDTLPSYPSSKEDAFHKESHSRKASRNGIIIGIFVIIISLILCCFIALLLFIADAISHEQPDSNIKTISKLLEDSPAKTPQGTPDHGFFYYGESRTTSGDNFIGQSGKRYAPLTLKFPKRGDNIYFIKLHNHLTGSIEYMIFGKDGGKNIEVNIQCDTYSISYATGTTWYGTNDLFGKETKCFKLDDPMKFYHDSSSAIGNTITLYSIPDDNLNVTEISADDF